MKRAGIYLVYDKNGIVDGYVPYFIQELHKVVDYIVTVVNGKLQPEGRRILAKVSDDLFVRPNEGYDAWGFKEGIEYIGWESLMEYDELVIANDSTFGPVYPFDEIFEYMEASDCDFWGMTTGYKNTAVKTWGGIPLKWGFKPDFVASNFHVYKSNVLHSYEFRSHWINLPKIKNYFEGGVYHEFELSQKLADAGFTAATVDEGAFRYECPNPTVNGAYEMITRYRMPIIRKKAFYDSNGTLDQCTDVPRKLMQYLEKETDYDCNLIWENLLRVTNQYDLKNWFNWNRILPLDYSEERDRTSRIAVIFHVFYIDCMEQYFHNIDAFPTGTHFYFTTDTQEKQAELQHMLAGRMERFRTEYRLIENRGRDVSALLIGCRDVVVNGDYDFICFMHEKKGIGGKSAFRSMGRDFSDCCFENTAPTADYVNNVIDLFDQQPRLGIAVPPPPRNEEYYASIGGSWSFNYNNVKKLLTELNIDVPLDEKKPPVAPYGTVFWFRPKALMPLFEYQWKFEDFAEEPAPTDGTVANAIERIYSLAAQKSGYYPSIIMNTGYAEQEVTRMTEIAHSQIDLMRRYLPRKPALRFMTSQLEEHMKKKAAVPKPSSVKRTDAVIPKARSPWKRFIRGMCPIGIWNLFRRVRCLAAGGVYREPKVKRGIVKSVVRACMPRYLWDCLRKAKCRQKGWIYIAD